LGGGEGKKPVRPGADEGDSLPISMLVSLIRLRELGRWKGGKKKKRMAKKS